MSTPQGKKTKLSLKAAEIFSILHKTYPDAHCELDYSTPLELLVATILSAQCTDVRVNMVTPSVFKKYRSIKAYAEAKPEELETLVHSTGFYRNKTKNIIGACSTILEKHSGEIPTTIEELAALPGVGRKTANVLLGNAYQINAGVVVDTHVSRLSQKLRLTHESNPEKIEKDLMRIFPAEQWALLSHLLIWHGRRRCNARKPDCANCEIQRLCPSSQAG